MTDLSALGPAAVDDTVLARMVGDLLGVEHPVLRDVRVEDVAYDVPAITTAGRHWVRGRAVVPTGPTDDQPFSLFCKRVQSWERHPFFAFVPEEVRASAAEGVPWRAEPAAYRSELADHLPDGLAMARALLVDDLDELSAAIWLPELPVREAVWDLERYRRAAGLLGRFAASEEVRRVVGEVGHRLTPWHYLHGRLAHQVLPALADDALWQHPLVAGAFDATLRDRLRAAAARAEQLTAELVDLPLLASHGDACPGNLLDTGDGALTMIDFGFLGPMPVGFDLGQLLVGEVQLGHDPGTDLAERGAACAAAYVAGLAEEGVEVALATVLRAHALHVVLYAGLSAVPFDLLDQPVTPGTEGTAPAARARLATYALDLLDATEP